MLETLVFVGLVLREPGHHLPVTHSAGEFVRRRITLFWPKVRFVLEERFGILLHVHQNRSKDEVPWLTKSLEYLKVGLALNGNHLGYFYEDLGETA
jgi:hypothetical protein